MKEFWLSEKASRVFEIANAEQKTIQPYVAELIEQINPKTLLDYGCGDSFISRLINKNIEIGLYDINMIEAQKAAQHLVDRNCKLFNAPDEIYNNYYDCIIFSFVLICLASKEEFEFILQNFKKYKTKDGKLITITTHPCFRQYEYRPFFSEYAVNKQFNYFNNCEPFELFLRDDEKEPVQFTDYHWTLSETINTLVNNGFCLEKILEIPDFTFDKIPCNQFYPPFLILICK